MTKFWLVIFTFFIACNFGTKSSSLSVLKQLNDFVEGQDFFSLKEYYEEQRDQLSNSDKLYFKAIILSAFNQPKSANITINQLLDNSELSNDTLINRLYRLKLQNHINLFEYLDAAKTSKLILTTYRIYNDSATIEMLENEISIWNALVSTPEQITIKNNDSQVPIIADKVGLTSIEVKFAGKSKNFIFDTGANFSGIKRSLVSELGLQLIEADFYVTAATGAHVKSDLAIAKELKIGEINFKNVVFLVLNDEDISFPKYDYYPNGAIGFPVISAMEEIRITKNKQLFIPKTATEYNFANFALDGLTPIIACKSSYGRLRFNFDTGATSTTLFRKYYLEHQEEIEKVYKKEELASSSAGGELNFKGYIIDSLELKIASSSASIKKIKLDFNKMDDETANFHGNLGQDYIKQFNEMIISFKYSSITFN